MTERRCDADYQGDQAIGEERLTDQHRRVLTEDLLGERWHERTDDVTQDGNWCICACGYAFIKPENHVNRTFDTWEDYGRCIEAIKGKGLMEEWWLYMLEKWETTAQLKFPWWLLDPARCLEIAEFMERRKG